MKQKIDYGHDDIAGLTAWLTSPFVIFAVITVVAWLVQQGFLSWQWWGTWLFALVAMIAIRIALRPLYQMLLQDKHRRGGPIATEGCFAGLCVYAAWVLIGAISIWQLGFTGAVITAISAPICSIGIAWVITIVNTPKRRR